MSIDPAVVPRPVPIVGEERRLLLIARDLGARALVTTGVQSQNAKRRKTLAAARAIQAAQAEMNMAEQAVIPALEGNLKAYNYFKVFDPRSMRATDDPMRQQVLDDVRERDAERNARLQTLDEEESDDEPYGGAPITDEELQRRADEDNEEAAAEFMREMGTRRTGAGDMTRADMKRLLDARRRTLQKDFERTRFPVGELLDDRDELRSERGARDAFVEENMRKLTRLLRRGDADSSLGDSTVDEDPNFPRDVEGWMDDAEEGSEEEPIPEEAAPETESDEGLFDRARNPRMNNQLTLTEIDRLREYIGRRAREEVDARLFDLREVEQMGGREAIIAQTAAELERQVVDAQAQNTRPGRTPTRPREAEGGATEGRRTIRMRIDPMTPSQSRRMIGP